MKRHTFRINSEHKTTMDIGILYPFQFSEVVRGQTTILKNSAMFRFQPLLAPAMVKMDAHIVSFYVPYRILWDGWNDFISCREKLMLPLTLLFFGSGFDNHLLNFRKTILEYAGFPKKWGVTAGENMEARFPYLWFLAYYKIWNDYFRDPDIQPEIDIEALAKKFTDGVVANSDETVAKWNENIQELFGLKRCNWGSDRFTKALLETQTEPNITLPVGSSGKPLQLRAPGQNNASVNLYIKSDGQGTVASTHKSSPPPWTGGPNPAWTDNPLLYEGGLTGVSMEDFKLATAAYNLAINQNRFGRRVEDYFKKYGIRNLDARLQRSELIGGYAETLKITDIIATSSDDLGKQAGHASGFASARKFKHYAPEDGVIISLCYLRPRADYVGGIPRHFLKRDALDFFQAEFQDVGYQPIYTVELGNDRMNMKLPEDEDQLEIFGYEKRYAEYRRQQNMITGELTPGEPLAHWANPRYWSTQPVLNSQFLECNPSNQIWASPNTDKCIAWFDRKMTIKTFVSPDGDPRIKV